MLYIDTPPEGFRKIDIGVGGGFADVNGPIYGRQNDDGLALGFIVADANCNGMGICHGGWMASIMDMLLAAGARSEPDLTGRFLMTISLSLDYLSAAPRGSWVEGRSQLLRRTRNIVFVQGLLSSGDTRLLRGSGVFKIGPETSLRSRFQPASIE